MVCRNSLWVEEQLRIGEICVRKRSTMLQNATGTHYKPEKGEAEEVLFDRNCNHVALIKSCAKQKDLFKGSRIHTVIRERGLIKKDIFLGSTLLNMYAKCGSLSKAQEVFDELPVRDVVAWTALIDAYAQHRHGEEALRYFEQMQGEGLSPNAITFLCIVKACGSIGSVEKGEEIHAMIVRHGFLEEKLELGNALVDMYSKCGELVKAQVVFDALQVRSIVSWNALIAGYAQHGHGKEALNCFERMHDEGLSHNAVTFFGALKACSSLETAEKGREIHAEVVRRGFLRNNVELGNTLVDMYVKCGALARAQQVFDELSARTVVSWNVLILGYVQHGLGEKALNCFEQMQDQDLSPDAVTFLCILKACGSIGAAEKGATAHTEIVRRRLLKNDVVLGNALVDMYAKCGALGKAEHVFGTLPIRDVVSWTALMVGYTQAGKQESVFDSFNKMIQENVRPNFVTFVVVLNACSHLGVVDEGQLYFETMIANFGIIPTPEHHTCMVDLFCRTGHFDKATALIKRMPSFDYLPAWFALLGACKKWGNVDIGRLAFKHAVRLDQTTALAYVYMSDIYATAGMQQRLKL